VDVRCPCPLMNSPQTRWRGYFPASKIVAGTPRCPSPIPSESPAKPPPTIVMGLYSLIPGPDLNPNLTLNLRFR
jgi:hypothetical protein